MDGLYDFYGDPCEQWIFTEITDAPEEVILYDSYAQERYTSMPTILMSENDADYLNQYGLLVSVSRLSSISLYDLSLSYTDTNVFNIYDDLYTEVYGQGLTTVTLKWNSTDTNAAATFRISSLETLVEPGIYFVKSKDTGGYLDISDDHTPNNEPWVNQQDFTGNNAQRWKFQYLSDGYYTIRSMNSDVNYYLGVSGNGTATDTPVALRTGAITDGMKWKISTTTSGAYKITPATGEANDRVLAVSFYVPGSGIGTKVRQRDYVNDTNYKDEWELHQLQYVIDVYNYYDAGFSVRYGETAFASANKIDSYVNAVFEQYANIFGLELISHSALYYPSAIDSCKGTVNSGNIDTLCSHANPHTILFGGPNSIENHFNSNTFPTGSDIITKAYWSGHRIQTDPNISEYNRSCSAGSSIYMVELSSFFDRDRDSKGILMHELNHQIGAPDHYHEELSDGRCRGGNLCSVCGVPGMKRPASCIMNHSRIDITSSTVICDGCKTDIINHLEGHH